MSNKLAIHKGRIDGWYCSVDNVYNDILTPKCCYCPELRPSSLDSIILSTAAKRQGLMAEKELYEQFYASEIALGEQMALDLNDDAALTEHIRKLEEICYKAKVRIIPLREKQRQLKAKNRPWLVPSDNDVEVEESIKTVAVRQARMSRMDKLQSVLDSIMDKNDSVGIVKQTNAVATEAQVKKTNFVEKAVKVQEVIVIKIEDSPIDFSKFK